MSEADAWLLSFGSGLRGAVGSRELLHLLPDVPPLFEIPLCPAHCHQVFVWEERILPLMDLGVYLRKQAPRDPPPLIGILAYPQRSRSEPGYGALILSEPPVQIRVRDDQACALPEAQAHWENLAIAWFEQPEWGSVPVLDIQRLFSPRETGTVRAGGSNEAC